MCLSVDVCFIAISLTLVINQRSHHTQGCCVCAMNSFDLLLCKDFCLEKKVILCVHKRFLFFVAGSCTHILLLSSIRKKQTTKSRLKNMLSWRKKDCLLLLLVIFFQKVFSILNSKYTKLSPWITSNKPHKVIKDCFSVFQFCVFCLLLTRSFVRQNSLTYGLSWFSFMINTRSTTTLSSQWCLIRQMHGKKVSSKTSLLR